MGNHPVEGMMNITMEKIKEMVDANTVIGDPIQSPNGTTLIPISKISYGFVSGGSDFSSKKEENRGLFGGGASAGVTIQPIAFISVGIDGEVKMLQVEPYTGSVDRVVGMLPEILEKMKALFKKDKAENKNSDVKSTLKKEKIEF